MKMYLRPFPKKGETYCHASGEYWEVLAVIWSEKLQAFNVICVSPLDRFTPHAIPIEKFLETLCPNKEGDHTCNYYRFTKERSHE